MRRSRTTLDDLDKHPRCARGDLVVSFSRTRIHSNVGRGWWEETFTVGRVTSITRDKRPSKWRNEFDRRIQPVPPPKSAMVFSASKYDVLAIINACAADQYRPARSTLRELLHDRRIHGMVNLSA